MNKKKLAIYLTLIAVFLLLHSTHILAQTPDDWDNPDPGGDLPIPGIVYFLAAMVGLGIKKLYHARKNH